MEKPILQGCCYCSSFTKGVDVTPNSSNWDSLGDLCTDVVSCFAGPSGKRLVVHFSLPGTHIRIDIGNVKAAGVLCVLGISFGLGTYVLYKIYDKFFRPSVRKKPKKGEFEYTLEDVEDEEICQILKGRDEMGNQQSSPVDIPVYYKAGFGVSLYKPVDYTGTGKARNRKIGANKAEPFEAIVNGNLRPRNGLTAVEHTSTDAEYLVNVRNIENHARNLNELRIEIDESGFVDEEAGIEHNGDKLSNSLKGNFSPTSLHEKNLRIDEESSSNSENSHRIDKNDGKEGNNDKRPSLDHLNLGPKLGKSSVLLTPPSEDESSGSQPAKSSSHTGPVSSQSTKSDVSDIHSEVVDHQPFETDEEREQLSPLPFDRSAHNTPEKICPRKLKQKLGEIVCRSTSQSANSSGCSSPDSFLLSYKLTGSSDYRESSLSGISSPDLELINSDTGDAALDASTFNELEDEIHGVEDEFENLSKEIQALSSKYSSHETGGHIFKEIFLRYPSIRVRQSEKGIHFFNASESDTDSVSHSGANDEEKDLSWDLENLLDIVYSDGSESGMGPYSITGRPSSRSSLASTVLPDASGNASYLDSSSINCSVDLGGSLYEDEFHLHLGTKALPSIVEQSPDSKSYCDMLDNIPDTDFHETSQCSMQDGTSLSVEHTDSSKTGTSPSCGNSEADCEVLGGGPGTTVLDTGYCSMEIVTSPVENGEEASPLMQEILPASPQDIFCEVSPNSASQTCSPVNLSALCNIGNRVKIEEYANEEWKGDTTTAKLIREAYQSIPSHCECCHLRRVRGDNYCGIRSTLYQTLVNGLPPLNIWASKTEAFECLKRAYSKKSSGIHRWNFAKRISYTSENRLEIMHKCLSVLYSKIEEMNEHSNYAEREQVLVRILNSDLDCDLELMEGVKLLMLLSAVHLHGDMEQGNDVPVFAWLLFARDTSENMSSFVRNHLNHVGDSGGLEQVEMCLLGYSLGVRIRVFRLKQFKDEDFISFYPEDGTEDWPIVSLIAEDDRHYNVPVL